MNDHYFTAEPASPSERRSLTLRLAGQNVTMQTAPGVFCPDRLDPGTSVLLQHAAEPPRNGTFLDIGCGWGPITTTLGLLRPTAQVWGVDVNNRALDLCADNLSAAGLTHCRAVRPSQVPDDVRFDLIWSNPPIRVGKTVLHDLMLTWLPRLTVGGAAYLVVQRNLGSDSLQSWLSGQLGASYRVNRLTSVKGFRIIEVGRLDEGGPTPRPATNDTTGAGDGA